jgi:hypothetical protein
MLFTSCVTIPRLSSANSVNTCCICMLVLKKTSQHKCKIGYVYIFIICHCAPTCISEPHLAYVWVPFHVHPEQVNRMWALLVLLPCSPHVI